MPKGMGYGTKYPAEGAPVRKNGGNDAIHDHRVTTGPTGGRTNQGKARNKSMGGAGKGY